MLAGTSKTSKLHSTLIKIPDIYFFIPAWFTFTSQTVHRFLLLLILLTKYNKKN